MKDVKVGRLGAATRLLYRHRVLQYVGKTIDGRFEVLREIGQGGMGIVYEARQIALDRKCALKLLLPTAFDIPTVKQRFAREAKLAAQVKHPNVVGILDTGTTRDGLPYIAMDYLEGESLDRTLMRERVLPWNRARHVVLQICGALAEAHSMGIVHRDLKPGNCMRISHAGDQDFIKLVDFGIAKALGGDDKQTKLTQRDMPIGTVDYMAYEQAYGRDDCDHRVDIWSTAVILFELVSGCLPFRGAQAAPPLQRLAAILSRDPAPLSFCAPAGSIPPGADELIARALEKDRDLRFQTIGEFRDALEALQMVTHEVTAPLPVVASQQEVTGPTEINPLDVINISHTPVLEPEKTQAPGSGPTMPAPSPLPEEPASTASPWREPYARHLAALLVLLIMIGTAIVLYAVVDWDEGAAGVASQPDVPRPEAAPPLPAEVMIAGSSSETSGAGPPVAEETMSPPTPVVKDPTVDPVKAVVPSKTSAPNPKKAACAAMRAQKKTEISACIGGSSLAFNLTLSTDASGVVSKIGIANTLLAEDAKYLCLRGKLMGAAIKGITGELSFPCALKRS